MINIFQTKKLIYLLFPGLLLKTLMPYGLFKTPDDKDVHHSKSTLSSIREKYEGETLQFNPNTSLTRFKYPGAYYSYEHYSNKEYHHTTPFGMESYFRNLSEYSPENNESCGFVSKIQVMSFYDTFWNDNIIPESYERHQTDAISADEAIEVSPGTLQLVTGDFTREEYYYFCHNSTNYNNSFQCYLTVLYNQVYGKDNTQQFESAIQHYEYQNVLNSFYDDNNFCVVTTYDNRTQNRFKQIIKEIIDSGNPAIVGIDSTQESGAGHYVVAYDYDGDTIKCNFGWGSEHTSNPIDFENYDIIENVTTLDFTQAGHTHSSNYIINNESYCGCNNLEDEIVTLNSILYRNISPTFYWKRFNFKSESYFIKFFYNVNTEIFSLTTTYNQITLSDEHWSSIISNGHGQQIYMSLIRTNYLGKFPATTKIITIPTGNLLNSVVLKTDYGFSDYYPTDDLTSQNYKTHCLSNGFTFRTRRYRTGYIHDEYVTMSCIKTGITEAYIEYAFNNPISELYVDLSHWGLLNNELLSSQTGVAELQIWHNKDPLDPNDTDRWICKADLLADSMNLPRDRTNPECYDFYFSSGTYCFRFYCAINSPIESDRNKGRICIGDMTIHFAA